MPRFRAKTITAASCHAKRQRDLLRNLESGTAWAVAARMRARTSDAGSGNGRRASWDSSSRRFGGSALGLMAFRVQRRAQLFERVAIPARRGVRADTKHVGDFRE